jgi:hypothetical protein
MGNADGSVWHFDGKKWKYIIQLRIPGYNRYGIQHIWGESANEVYLIGAKMPDENDDLDINGIFKYDGSKWKLMEMPEIRKNGNKICKDKNGDLLFYCSEYSNSKLTLYSWNGTELKTVCESILGYLDICRAGEKVIIIQDHKIYEYDNGAMKLLSDFRGSVKIARILYGKNEKDIFVGLYSGNNTFSIAHYNGTNIEKLYELNGPHYLVGGLMIEDEVLITAWDLSITKTKFIHGKLKN